MKIKLPTVAILISLFLGVGAMPTFAAKCKVVVNGVVVKKNHDSPCIYNETITENGATTVTNNIKAKAKSGGNSGSVTTGNATVIVNITNIINQNSP